MELVERMINHMDDVGLAKVKEETIILGKQVAIKEDMIFLNAFLLDWPQDMLDLKKTKNTILYPQVHKTKEIQSDHIVPRSDIEPNIQVHNPTTTLSNPWLN